MTDNQYRIITGGCSFSKRADVPIMKEKENEEMERKKQEFLKQQQGIKKARF